MLITGTATHWLVTEEILLSEQQRHVQGKSSKLVTRIKTI